jgi:hypothetical protein
VERWYQVPEYAGTVTLALFVIWGVGYLVVQIVTGQFEERDDG